MAHLAGQLLFVTTSALAGLLGASSAMAAQVSVSYLALSPQSAFGFLADEATGDTTVQSEVIVQQDTGPSDLVEFRGLAIARDTDENGGFVESLQFDPPLGDYASGRRHGCYDCGRPTRDDKMPCATRVRSLATRLRHDTSESEER